MAMEEVLIDADGHILEPPDLWEKYLEPKYRDRAIRIKRGDDGREYLEIDNKVSALTSPTLLASLGGMKKLQELGATVEDVNAKRRDLLKARSGEKHRVFDSLEGVETVESYVGGAAYGAMDAKERLALLDTEGMAKTILYPTIGLLWEAELFDADLSDAYCRAYNRWIADFCRDSGGRLVPIAHINLLDIDLAIAEAARARKDGCVGIYLSPDPASPESASNMLTMTRSPHSAIASTRRRPSAAFVPNRASGSIPSTCRTARSFVPPAPRTTDPRPLARTMTSPIPGCRTRPSTRPG